MGTFLDINIVRKIFIKPFTTSKKLGGNTVDGSVGIDDQDIQKQEDEKKKSSALGSFFKGIISPSGIKVISIAIMIPLMFLLAPFSLPILITCTALSVVGTGYSIYREGKNLRDLKVQQTEALLLKELADLKEVCVKKGITCEIESPKAAKNKPIKPSNRLLTSTLPDSTISIGSSIVTLNPIAIGIGIFASLCSAVTTAERQRQIDNQQKAFEKIREESMKKADFKITPGAKGNIQALKEAINHIRKNQPAFKLDDKVIHLPPQIEITEPKSTAHYMWTSFKAGFDPAKTAKQNAPLARYNDIIPESLKDKEELQYSYKIIDKDHNYKDHTYDFNKQKQSTTERKTKLSELNWKELIKYEQDQTKSTGALNNSNHIEH